MILLFFALVLLSLTVAVWLCRWRWKHFLKISSETENPAFPPKILETKRILVVGTGVSGLAAAKSFLQYGYKNVIVLEKSEAEIGGVWRSDQYRGASIQSPYWLYEFPDFLWPRDLLASGNEPDQAAVQEYCQRYAKHFGVWEHIRFGHEAVKATRTKDNIWQVHTTQHGTIEAEVLIMAIGNNDKSNPKIPDITNRSIYKGTELHSSQVGAGEIFQQENVHSVAVVGGSHSAFDIGLMQPQKTTMVMRQPHHWTPRWVLHLPWFDRLAFFIFRGYKPEKSQRSFLTRILDEIGLYLVMIGVATPQNHSVLDDVMNGGGLHICCTMKEYWTAKKYWKVEVGSAPAEYTENGLKLDNGKHVQADVVVLGTGFRPTNFLKTFFTDIKLQDSMDDGLYLHKYMVHPKLPDCYFCGFRDPSIDVPFVSNIQALWMAYSVGGLLNLPDSDNMTQIIQDRMKYTRTHFPMSHRRAFYDWFLYEPSHCNYAYTLDLVKEMGRLSLMPKWGCHPMNPWTKASEYAAVVGARNAPRKDDAAPSGVWTPLLKQ